MEKFKIKLVSLSQKFNGDYYDDYSSVFVALLSDFKTMELNWEELNRLQTAVRIYNEKKKYGETQIVIIREVEDEEVKEIFDDYEKYLEKEEKAKQERENAARKAKEAREAKAREKKLKQLEKLKKELGETDAE